MLKVYRDNTRTNVNINRRQRLPTNAVIRVSKMTANADLVGGTGSTTVNMPYEGNLHLTVTNSVCDDIIVINNPFVQTTSTVVISSQPIYSNATFTREQGRILLTLNGITDGLYILSVGDF